MAIIVSNRIALLFLSLAAATDTASGRILYGSSGSSGDSGDSEDSEDSHRGYRHPSKQCLEYGTPAKRILYGSSREKDSPKQKCITRGFSVKGPTDAQSAATVASDCCDAAVGCDMFNVTSYDQDCIAAFFLTYPFRHEFGYLTDSYQFTDEDYFLGTGSFKGSLPGINGDEKTRLIYNSMPYNRFNNEMWNRPVADLDYIEYSFKAESCGSKLSPCPSEFYLNVYTRTDATSVAYYDCKYDFTPAVGGEAGLAVGEGWATVRFDLAAPAVNTMTYNPVDKIANPRDRCPDAGARQNDPLQAAADAEFVLGTNEQPVVGSGIGQIFALNMGDTGIDDAGLAGYFDKVVIKLKGESARIYDL